MEVIGKGAWLMKKLFTLLLAVCSILTCFAACDTLAAPCEHIVSEYKYDEYQHWRIVTCSWQRCDVNPKREDHVNTDADNYCDLCGYVMITEHEHTCEWVTNAETHFKQYTCGCDSPDIAGLHSDHNGDGKCDVCGHFMESSSSPDYSVTMHDEAWLWEDLKPTYKAGDQVSVKIGMALDVGYLFLVNGEKIATCKDVDGLYWEFTFTMPASNVVVDFKTYDGFLPDYNYAVLIESYFMQNLDAESVAVRNYYGEFASGAIVAMLEVGGYGYDDALGEETVGGVVIRYNNGNRITVLYEGDFYSLTQAYENGYLTKEDIAEIAERQREFYPYLYVEN